MCLQLLLFHLCYGFGNSYLAGLFKKEHLYVCVIHSRRLICAHPTLFKQHLYFCLNFHPIHPIFYPQPSRFFPLYLVVSSAFSLSSGLLPIPTSLPLGFSTVTTLVGVLTQHQLSLGFTLASYSKQMHSVHPHFLAVNSTYPSLISFQH